MNPSGKCMDIPRSVRHLGPPEHLHVGCVPVEIEGIAPGFLCVSHQMHVPREKEHFPAPVIPSVVRRQHIVILPGIRPPPECRETEVRLVFQMGCLDEDGVREHVHVPGESESFQLGIVGSVIALDDLPVFVPHSPTAAENCHAVLCVVVQMPGPQRVVILIGQLDDLSTEPGKVLVNQINETLAGEHSAVLDYADIANRVNDPRVNIPKGCVTVEIGVVVKKLSMSGHLPDVLSVDFDDSRRCGGDQTDKTVSLLLLLGNGRQRKNKQRQKDKCLLQGHHHSSLNFVDQPSLSKAQSLKIGSMTMRVDLIFSSRNLSMASTDFSCLAYSRRRL